MYMVNLGTVGLVKAGIVSALCQKYDDRLREHLLIFLGSDNHKWRCSHQAPANTSWIVIPLAFHRCRISRRKERSPVHALDSVGGTHDK